MHELDEVLKRLSLKQDHVNDLRIVAAGPTTERHVLEGMSCLRAGAVTLLDEAAAQRASGDDAEHRRDAQRLEQAARAMLVDLGTLMDAVLR